jgi:hypothetical protein
LIAGAAVLCMITLLYPAGRTLVFGVVARPSVEDETKLRSDVQVEMDTDRGLIAVSLCGNYETGQGGATGDRISFTRLLPRSLVGNAADRKDDNLCLL